MSTAYVESARPYPGLRPFEPHEADIFFGREEHTDRLLEILRAQRFLAVIGPSGSGKSSLVRAGLLPALAMGGLGSGSVWRVAVLRPGDRPIERLAAALLQALSAEYGAATDDVPGAAADASADPVDVATLAAELRRGPLGLLHAVEAAWQRGDGASNLLVLVDQFEELFTYAEAAGPGRDESEAFVRLLLAARRSPAARIHVAMTMRTDFLGHCVRWLELPDEINRAQYLTPRLDRQQMERAILAPAQVFGGAIEASLVAELINATGHNSDQLPLVQHALSRMWPLAQSRTPGAPHIGWDDARAIGGVEGAPDQHAETLLAATLATLPPTRTNLPEALFRLITARRAGGQDVRAPRTLARITAACGLEPAQWLLVAEVVRPWAAADASLLQHGARLDPDSVIDLSHEALIRQWKRLGDWVADEARRAAEYRRWVERAADEDRPDGVPLTGADLARALDWLNPEPAQSLRPWQPSAAWAARYAAHTEDEGASAVEYERTVRYILSSRQARERAAAEAAQRALEASQIASERAHAQETTRLLRRARIALIAAAVAGVAVLGAVSWALLQTREAASAQEEAARLERLRAGDEQARARREAEQQVQAASAAAAAARALAEQSNAARMQAEKLRQQAQRAEARASRAAREAAASEQQALLALADLKEQQALAEARRREAESSAAQAAASERRLRTLGTQEVLNAVYDAGLVVDGLFGMRTAVEVRRLQADVGLPTSGQLDDATWACVQRLLRVPVVGRAGALQRECGSGATPTPTTLELQRFLGERGFSVPMDGGLGMVTQLSLRRFQTLTGIAPTGQIDAATSACIARVRALPADRKDEALRGTCAGP